MSKKCHRFASIILLSSFMAAPFTAFSAPITYDFTVNGGSVGPLAGVTANGFFTFDSSVVADADIDNFAIVEGPALFQDFQLTWNGISYDTSSIATTYLQFEIDFDRASDRVLSLSFGNNCAFGSCSVRPGTNDWFFDGAVNNLDSFVFALATDSASFYRGSASFRRRDANVPEPATLSLMGLGLLGLGVARRRLRA